MPLLLQACLAVYTATFALAVWATTLLNQGEGLPTGSAAVYGTWAALGCVALGWSTTFNLYPHYEHSSIRFRGSKELTASCCRGRMCGLDACGLRLGGACLEHLWM